MTQSADSDQRRYIRFELFEYALADVPMQLEPHQVVIVNIGLGGLQLRARHEIPAGCICKLVISNVDLPKLTIPVEVRHCDKVEGSELYAIGVRFRPTGHEERLLIASYVHSVFQRQCDLLTL